MWAFFCGPVSFWNRVRSRAAEGVERLIGRQRRDGELAPVADLDALLHVRPPVRRLMAGAAEPAHEQRQAMVGVVSLDEAAAQRIPAPDAPAPLARPGPHELA